MVSEDIAVGLMEDYASVHEAGNAGEDHSGSAG